METVYLSLGSNLGDRMQNLRDAVARLNGPGFHVQSVSHVYESEPVGETEQPVPPYLNCAIRAETGLLPLALLDYTQAAELAGGRIRTFRWGPRTIDIDILLYGGATVDSERLKLPHPRLAERAFALRPLADLSPGLALPDGRLVEAFLAQPHVQSQKLTRYAALSESARLS